MRIILMVDSFPYAVLAAGATESYARDLCKDMTAESRVRYEFRLAPELPLLTDR